MRKITFLRNLIVLVALLIGSGSAMGQGTETFTHSSSSTSYVTISWTGDNGLSWSSTDSRGDQVITTSNKAVTVRTGAITGQLTTAQQSAGIGKLSFDYKIPYSDATKNITATITAGSKVIAHNIGLLTVSQVYNTGEIEINSSDASSIIIAITSSATGARLTIDNLVWTAYSSNTVSTPTFSPEAGTYYSAQNVTIDTDTEGATIRYTTNGDEPTESSAIYSSPISVSSTTTIKAKAFKTDMDPSEVTSATYTIVMTPTITLTEESIPAMSANVGGTDTDNITVNAVNLTGDITLTVTGTNESLFTLSTYTLTQSSGSVSNQSVTITYTPDAPATSHTATLTLSSPGAESVVKNLSGSATLAKPIATDATGISPSGFTANWDAVPGAASYELDVYKKTGQSPVDLFISEYVEGSSSNKYIEIFNGTGNAIDLADYKLELYPNGGTTANPSVTLSGILSSGSVIVYRNNNAALTLPVGVSATVNNAVNYNGDDAIALYKISTSSYVDIFGVIGKDPGTEWTGDGGYTTVDKTLRRKSTVTGGVTVSPTGEGPTGFTTLTTEWDLYDNNNVDDLGSHTFNGVTITPVSGSPFTVTGETSKAITGLTSSTQYFYTVKAKNGSFESLVSEEESVITSFGTSTDNPSSFTSIYAHNAQIHFSATAGERVEVYNAVGQKIISTLATDGLNAVNVNAKGVMIVKVGSRLAKVIL